MKTIEEQTTQAAFDYCERAHEYDELYNAFTEGAEWERKRDKWISVDQPPTKDGYYLAHILRPLLQTAVLYYCKRYGWANGAYVVSHYMPLREPPKEDEK